MLKEEQKGAPPQENVKIKKVSIPCGLVNDQSTVFYTINVYDGFNSWAVSKRYSQFEEFHNQIMLKYPKMKLPKLPPKKFKLFTSHVSAGFIEERRVLLENYLTRLIKTKLSESSSLLKFLTTNKTKKVSEAKSAATEKVPDDVEVTDIAIPATRTMPDHVLYQIDLVNNKKRKSFSKWTVLKRFGQFYEMDASIRAVFATQPNIINKMPAAPQRKAKLFNDHMDSNFIENRRVLLSNYLKKMQNVPEVLRCRIFLKFLGVKV